MQRAVSFPAVQFHLSVEGNGSTVRERKDEKKKKNIPRFYVIILSFFFLFASQLLTQRSIKKKKKEKKRKTDSTMASVCRDLHQVSTRFVRYESSSAQSTIRYRVEVRVTDLWIAYRRWIEQSFWLTSDRPFWLSAEMIFFALLDGELNHRFHPGPAIITIRIFHGVRESKRSFEFERSTVFNRVRKKLSLSLANSPFFQF